jgi:hypothetical protein
LDHEYADFINRLINPLMDSFDNIIGRWCKLGGKTKLEEEHYYGDAGNMYLVLRLFLTLCTS